ncbi:hypothetical protein J2848_005829 [Azospirillum lipoferum]|uniref:hypothetical protein n=1 Tax=Azospirillum TaxID=191 RepID=UPI0014796D76|nr:MULTISPECIES: hypothetical protein [Azospirillum]MCP1614126.1 hypothetical protein [Azospirillum lipoferum]MDW5536812.1 hypothetical protein [Azospirillum sp. NL1]
MQEDDAGGGRDGGRFRRDPADRSGDRPQVTGILLGEPGIEESRSFRAWKSKKPLSDKADLLLKTMNGTITEVMF